MCMPANGVRMELEWSRLELGLLFGGCAAGGMRTADALEELADVRFSNFFKICCRYKQKGQVYFLDVPDDLDSFTGITHQGIMYHM